MNQKAPMPPRTMLLLKLGDSPKYTVNSVENLGDLPPGLHGFILAEDHTALCEEQVRAARAEAFEEVAAHAMKEAHDAAGEPFQDMDGAQHYARLSGWAKAQAQKARLEPSQPAKVGEE